VPSLRSTKAIRAAAFLVWGMGARAVPKPVCMGGWRFSLPNLFWPAKTGLAKVLRAFLRYKSVITNGRLTGYLRGLAKDATPVRHARLYRGASLRLGRRGRLPLRERGLSLRKNGLRPAFEDYGSVGSSEAEGVGERVIQAGFAGLVGDEVHVFRVGILVFEVDGWGQNLVAQSQH
jgi:hypothetical protein